MSTSQLAEDEIGISDKLCVDAETTAAKCKHNSEYPVSQIQSSSEPSESISDWLVVVCVFLTNLLNGLNYGSYGVLYLSKVDLFQSSRAAVGLIQAFDFALGNFLGELYFLFVPAVCVYTTFTKV